MKRFLVGGAVRNWLMDLPVSERDWLVTGATEEELQRLGYRRVGRHFPVFLHPVTAEEHALPRGPRQGDETAQVTEDLRRRDLTLNALALDPAGRLLDPLGGRRDIEQRLLHHGPAFSEDPLRVLRLARFAARYHALGFRAADDTLALCRRMAQEGALERLPAERIWGEIGKSLAGPHPEVFFALLRETGALARLLPELDALFGVPQPAAHHPEIDSGVHALMALDAACRLSDDPRVRFAALLHDLGKGLTPAAEWPRHIGHEARSARLADALSRRLRVPNDYRELAVLTARYHLLCHNARQLRPATLLRLLKALDAFRRPRRLEQFILACRADQLGRGADADQSYPQGEYLHAVCRAANAVDAGALAAACDTPDRVAQALHRGRESAIVQLRREWTDAQNSEKPPPID